MYACIAIIGWEITHAEVHVHICTHLPADLGFTSMWWLLEIEEISTFFLDGVYEATQYKFSLDKLAAIAIINSIT